MPRSARTLLVMLLVASAPVAGWTYFQHSSPGTQMTDAAAAFLKLLDDNQRKIAQRSFFDSTEQRVNWHFIPKDERKGLQLKHMTPEQREAAHKLLKTALSESGYDKATRIMEIEKLLNAVEKGGRFVRDPERYYFTIFGVNLRDRWGLSVEGHHLSLNFVVHNGEVIATTPQFLGANPATVKNENNSGFPVGTRILAREEQLAFDLVNRLSSTQRKTAIIDDKAPREIRAAGEPQPPTDPPAGIAAGELSSDQQQLLRELIDEYAKVVPAEIAAKRMAAIDEAGFNEVHFAWAGATEPGIGHYYRIQGDTFLIEFVNTQPDVYGNPANHIHSVWRSMKGDFAIPIK